MAETYSRSRQQAEVAFGKAQTEFFARGQAVEVLDSIAQARDEKTLRLREARKAKELIDRLSAITAVAANAQRRPNPPGAIATHPGRRLEKHQR